MALCLGLAAISGTSLLFACSSTDPTPTPSADSGTDASNRPRTTPSDNDNDDDDAGTKADAKAPKPQTYGDAGDGDVCELNRSCQAGLRCECNEDTGCACKPGERGVGQSGVGPCSSPNDCASAVCIEKGKTSFCSDECTIDADCPSELPRCLPIIGFSVQICSPEASK